MTLMRGATYVRESIAAFLAQAMPVTMATARTDWGLDEYHLPDPAMIYTTERYALDHYPCVVVTVESVDGFERFGHTETSAQKYRPRYKARLFTWVRTPRDSGGTVIEPEFAETIRLRDDYAAVVRATLLRYGSLLGEGLLWHEDTYVESFSDVTSAKGDRFVAGAAHTFDVQVDEELVLPAVGSADVFDLDWYAFGATSADLEPEEGP